MRAVVAVEPGPAEVMQVAEVDDPVAGPGEVVLDVAAAGVNRADLLQRQGHYPPPPGASPLIGLECSGTVRTAGPGVTDWAPGDRACALLSGGGYAEQVAVLVDQLLPVPSTCSMVEAAALPEAACTAWSNLVTTAGLGKGQAVLIHGGGSGIGTMAVQVAALVGADAWVTVGSETKAEICRRLGASGTINYREQDFVAEIREATGGRGADVILDIIGAKYLGANLRALARDGRLVVIGLQGGVTADLDLGRLLTHRLSVIGTTLRSRSPADKARVVEQVARNVWPAVESGRVRPVVDRVLPLHEAAEAHRLLEQGSVVGKVVLQVG